MSYTIRTEADRYLIGAALRFAAQQFDRDAAANAGHGDSVVRQFQDQATRCRHLANAIEDADDE
jgi:hypothetical protein